jgi:hypothetical protein
VNKLDAHAICRYFRPSRNGAKHSQKKYLSRNRISRATISFHPKRSLLNRNAFREIARLIANRRELPLLLQKAG